MTPTITPEALNRAIDAACKAADVESLPNKALSALIAGWEALQESPRSPSYEALDLIARSVVGALERAGVNDCDDPGEAIDVLRERYERRVAELQAAPAAAGVPDSAVTKAWNRFVAAVAPTNDEIEEFASGYTDELGDLPSDSVAEFGMALLKAFSRRMYEPEGQPNYERMFIAACAALAEVSRELGCDPDQGGSEPIIEAIRELRQQRDESVDDCYVLSGQPAAQPQADQQGAACRKCGGTGEVEVPMPINGCETDTTVIGCDDCADSALAARQPVGHLAEPIFQIKHHDDTEATWRDATEAAYEMQPTALRRIVYAAPPQQPERVDLSALREIASDLLHSSKVDDYEVDQIKFITSIRVRLLALINQQESKP